MSAPGSSAKTISLSVSERSAAYYNALPKDRKKKLESYMDQALQEARETNVKELLSLMDEIGEEARGRGLTEQALKDILEEETN